MGTDMAGTASASVDRIEIIGGTERGLRERRGELAVLGLAVIFPTTFLVLMVEDHGSEMVMWEGTNYEQAIIAAEECAAGWRVPVLDRVVE